MLRPVVIRANYKVASSHTVTLESICGINLPLMFPKLQIWNRTPTACNVTINAVTNVFLMNQVDPDFNGTITSPTFSSLALATGTNSGILQLPQTLEPVLYGMTTVLTLTNAGPAAEARITLLLQGLIESSVVPDPLLVITI